MKEVSSYYKNVIPEMHDKISDAIIAMMATGDLPYYGEFALFINFLEAKNKEIPTAGVNVSTSGMNFYWNRDFIDSLSPGAVNFLLLHEEMHLLFDHIKRTVGYDQKMANIAQDMIINQIIHDEIMEAQGLGKGDKPFIEIPKDEQKNNSGLFIPKEYKGEPIFEEVYEWLINEQKKWREENKEKIKGMKKSNQCSNCGSDMGDQDGDGNGDGSDGGNKEDGEKDGDNTKDGKGKGKGEKEGDGEGDGEGDTEEKGKGKGKGNGSSDGDGGEESDGNGGDGKTCPNCGHENEGGNESRKGDKDTDGKPRYGKYGKNDVECYSKETIFEGEEMNEQNTLDVHLTDEVPPEMKREVVEGVMQTLKSRGLESADIEAIINKLRKSKKDYLKEIKRTMNNHVFGTKKNKTIVRPHRRGITGLKGTKKYKNEINCILDTSGSMGGEFEKVLSYIFQNDIQINLIQIDTQVQGVTKIKDKKQLEVMKIRGLGGTVLQPAIDFMADPKNKIHSNNTVILTDGWTDSLDFKHVKTKTLILSTAQKCPVTFDNGRIKQIENIGQQDS